MIVLLRDIMKFLNTIPNLSLQEQRRFSCWFYSSIAILATLVCLMSGITIWQSVILQTKATSTKPTFSTNQLGQQRTKLLQEHAALEKKIAEYYAQPATYLAIIAEILPAQVLLTTYFFEAHKKISLEGKAQTEPALRHFIHMLEQWMTGKKVHIQHISKNSSDSELNFTITIPW